MCGVVAYTGQDNATDLIYEGLLRLEYRGYDSAGIAVSDGESIHLAKNVGKIRHLRSKISSCLPAAPAGIGHTRWATHGAPTDENAHPHLSCDERIAIVHNGIIENYLELIDELKAAGHRFRSATDSEVIAHLVEQYYEGDLLAAFRRCLERLEGAFAIAMIHRDHPGTIMGTRRLSPLIAGFGQSENFLASDVTAILSYTREVHYLQDDEVAVLTPASILLYDLKGAARDPRPTTVDWNPLLAERCGYDHFMLKEIFEQPEVLRNTLGGRTDRANGAIRLPEMDLDEGELRRFDRIYLVACGTAYFAACVGKYLVEGRARIPSDVALASEFRYADPVLTPATLVVGISQSGETVDTLAALRRAREGGARTLAICNVKGSTITREVDSTLYIHAGPEIGVASTKAYSAMLVALDLLALRLAQVRGTLDREAMREAIDGLRALDQKVNDFLTSGRKHVEEVARKYARAKNFLYLGRYINFPTALEGALKLKEISYIHAEGYAAGEMKHGPIALVDEHVPTLAVATRGRTYEKVLSNIKEVKARGGRVIAVASEGDSIIEKYADDVIFVPEVGELFSPVVNIVPLQLLAYHIANIRGADVDQPRNLAKSVTVE